MNFSIISLCAVLGAVAVTVADAATSSSSTRSISGRRMMLRPWALPRGGQMPVESSYASKLEAVKEKVLTSTLPSIEELRKLIISEKTTVEDFGVKADTIVNKALEEFASNVPEGNEEEASSSSSSELYETKLEQIDAALDAPLQVLYLKQLQLLREQALLNFRKASTSGNSGTSEYEAMLQADQFFVREAEQSTRDEANADLVDGGWDFSSERVALQSVMNRLAESGSTVTDIKVQSAATQQTAMAFLQNQAQMIQQLQQQLYGQQSPWNIGVAYRVPDTNFNLQGSYQQGKTNLALSCVPDEYAPFLGPNGFTNGVGPGNLGLSLNLSV